MEGREATEKDWEKERSGKVKVTVGSAEDGPDVDDTVGERRA
jgi:hypothetical protein